ncbi:MFS transporter [Caldovatus aquaticus]|uniref:MFS transporter n=1 Tax=Caldovatus aquaticus TaxID=2865671 RepID=A0ABS7F5F8_9PROT|nr:MFS transporter [Caldovatus aquaticus]MBW8270036.1 MFS transporter [Caldovatus aquaticus]
MRAAGGLAAALAATTAAQGLATLAVFVLPVLAPAATRELRIAPHWIGYQVALVYGAAAIGSVLSVGALRRFGPARCTQIALGAAAFACLAMALGGVAGVLFGSLLVGGGYGLTNPAASQVLARLAPPARRNMVFAVKQMGVPIGAALAGLLLPGASLALGWRGTALAVAAALLAAALALGAFRPHWDAERDPRGRLLRGGAGSGLAALRERPGLAALAAVGGLYSALQLAFGAYAVTMLVEEFGWGPVAAGAAAATAQVLGALARLAWGMAADLWRSGLGVLAAIGLASAAGVLALPFAVRWPETAVLAVFCALGASVAGWNGVLMAEAARLAAPGRAGEAAGGVLAVTFAGVVAGPSLLALVVGALGSYALAFAALAVLPLAGALAAWRTRRREAAAGAAGNR